MGPNLTSTVGQFSIVDGSVQEDAPNLLVTRGQDGTQLSIAVELVGHSLGEEQIYSELLQAISDAYYRYPGNTAGRLQEAIQEANALLVHANAGLVQRDWLLGGVTCVCHTGRDIYIGQAGPAVVYVAQKGSLQRFPEESPWFQQPLPTSADRIYPTPLGVHASIHPNLFHATVQPGDVVVLSTTPLASALSTRDIEEAVVFQSIDDALYNLARLCGESDAACMVVVIHPAGQPPRSAPRAPEPEPEPVEEEDLFDEVEIPEDEPLAEEEPDFLVAPLEEGMPEPDAESLTWDTDELTSRVYPTPGEARLREVRNRMNGHNGKPSGVSLLHIGRQIGAAFRQFLADLQLGFTVIVGAILSLFRRRPRRQREREARPVAPSRKAKRPIATVWKYAAIGLPVVVIGVIVALVLQSNARNQRYEDLLTQSQAKLVSAQSAATVQDKHALLAEAVGLAAQAQEVKRDDPRTAQLQAQVQITLDQVDGTVRLESPRLLYHATPGSETGLRRLIVSGLEVYLLDGSGQVLRQQLDDSGVALGEVQGPPVLIEQGISLEDQTLGAPLEIAWASTGGSRVQSGLLAVTQNNLLVEYSLRRGLALLKVANTERWAQPVAMATYGGKLYVMDAAVNQIFRYASTQDGYSEPPEDWFSMSQPRDLRGAVDLAIDGAIYVLFGDGRMEKFMTGDLQDFPLDGLAEPLKRPSAVFTDVTEEVRHVYVAEPGDGRIVQFTKEGQFVRQFRFKQNSVLSAVSDLHVSEAEGRLYFTSGNALYVCALP